MLPTQQNLLEILNSNGLKLYKERKYNESIDCFEQALSFKEINSNQEMFGTLHYHLGCVFQKMNKLEKAKNQFLSSYQIRKLFNKPLLTSQTEKKILKCQRLLKEQTQKERERENGNEKKQKQKPKQKKKEQEKEKEKEKENENEKEKKQKTETQKLKNFFCKEIKYIINASPDSIVRFDLNKIKNNQQIYGLGTHELNNCLAIIILDQKGKISLINKSPKLNWEFVLEEMKWFSSQTNELQIYVISQDLLQRNTNRKMNAKEEAIQKLKKAHLKESKLALKNYKVIYQKTASGSICIDQKNNIFIPNEKESQNLVHLIDPFFQFNYYVNNLNRIINNQQEINIKPNLEFNEMKWTLNKNPISENCQKVLDCTRLEMEFFKNKNLKIHNNKEIKIILKKKLMEYLKMPPNEENSYFKKIIIMKNNTQINQKEKENGIEIEIEKKNEQGKENEMEKKRENESEEEEEKEKENENEEKKENEKENEIEKKKEKKIEKEGGKNAEKEMTINSGSLKIVIDSIYQIKKYLLKDKIKLIESQSLIILNKIVPIFHAKLNQNYYASCYSNIIDELSINLLNNKFVENNFQNINIQILDNSDFRKTIYCLIIPNINITQKIKGDEIGNGDKIINLYQKIFPSFYNKLNQNIINNKKKKKIINKNKYFQKVWFAEKIPILGGKPKLIPISEFEKKVSENFKLIYKPIFPKKVLNHCQKHALRNLPNPTNNFRPQFEAHLKNPGLDRFLVCKMGTNLGYGVFARKEIPLGSILSIYSGILTYKAKSFEYGFDIDTYTGKSDFSFSGENVGSISRFFQHLPQKYSGFIDTFKDYFAEVEKKDKNRNRNKNKNRNQNQNQNEDENEDTIKSNIKTFLFFNGYHSPVEQERIINSFYQDIKSGRSDEFIKGNKQYNRTKSKYFELKFFLEDLIHKYSFDKSDVQTCNIGISSIVYENKPYLIMISSKTIKKNEQIGYSYGLSYWTTKKIMPDIFYVNGKTIPRKLYKYKNLSIFAKLPILGKIEKRAYLYSKTQYAKDCLLKKPIQIAEIDHPVSLFKLRKRMVKYNVLPDYHGNLPHINHPFYRQVCDLFPKDIQIDMFYSKPFNLKYHVFHQDFIDGEKKKNIFDKKKGREEKTGKGGRKRTEGEEGDDFDFDFSKVDELDLVFRCKTLERWAQLNTLISSSFLRSFCNFFLFSKEILINNVIANNPSILLFSRMLSLSGKEIASQCFTKKFKKENLPQVPEETDCIMKKDGHYMIVPSTNVDFEFY
ncbi:remodeling and spacing factor [Anaeramoeba flamelloides]|uniref:Remodeling and spacing factor n=1 Tax=Anaeramoeba flamelloides TaxID=1746091 RepID=A0AAV7ZYG1_9EUKA|nr:remodeling and spacing factor [Anaeramoeba flamelloides]